MFHLSVSKKEKEIFISTKEMIYIQHNEKSLVLWVNPDDKCTNGYLRYIKEINDKLNEYRENIKNNNNHVYYNLVTYSIKDILPLMKTPIESASNVYLSNEYLIRLVDIFSQNGYVLKSNFEYTVEELIKSLVKLNTVVSGEKLELTDLVFHANIKLLKKDNLKYYYIHTSLIDKYNINYRNINFDTLNIKQAFEQWQQNKLVYIHKNDISTIIESFLKISDTNTYCITVNGVSKIYSDATFRVYYKTVDDYIEDNENPEYIIIGNIKYHILTKIPEHEKHFVTKYNGKLQLLDLTDVQCQLVKTIKQKQICNIEGVV